MKKITLSLLMVASLLSCKQDANKVSHEEGHEQSPSQITLVQDLETKEEKKVLKIKSITRKDFYADYKYGDYIQGKQANKVVRKFNEDNLPYEIEIEVMDPSQTKVAGDTLARATNNVFVYVPKRNGDRIEMYTEAGDLVEILFREGNKMIGYTVDNDEEPFVIRQFDTDGNYDYQVINGDEFLYVTKHNIVEKDANGFATKSHAVRMQLKKRADIDYNNFDYSTLELVSKNYQVVVFKYEVY
jgi:hypothetical protein